MSTNDLSLEKMKISDRLTVLEITNTQMIVKMDSLLESNKNMVSIMTGNGHPEEGIVFRVAKIESNEAGKKQNSMAIWTFLSALGVVIAGDIIHQVFFHHPKGG